MDDNKMKPIVSMAIMKIKSKKDSPMDEPSFEKEGLRAAAEQMIKAIREVDYMGEGLNNEPRKIREDESPKEYALRIKADELQKQAREEKKIMYLDSFIEAFCDFLEMKYELNEEKEDEE